MGDTNWALLAATFAIIVVGLYIDYRYKRSPRGIEAARQRTAREQEARAKQEQAAGARADWAREHPRLASLWWAVCAGAFAAGSLWLALRPNTEKAAEWLFWTLLLLSAGAAIVAAFNLLAAIFTSSGAASVIEWAIVGGVAIWIINAAFDSIRGTIALGVVVIVAVIWKGVEEIKREIRNRQSEVDGKRGEQP
jgi:hypothetical protein